MESLSDKVELIVENVPIQCQRKDLSSRSDYFRAMFEGNFAERHKNSITLEGIDLNSMNMILKLFWDSTLFIPNEDILQLLQASCMLQFNDIKQKCIEQIVETLRPINLLQVWFVAESLGLTSLFLKAKNLALIEFNKIKETDVHKDLNLKQLHVYLSNVELNVRHEMDVFNFCMKWFYEKGQCDDQTLISLLSCIDFNAISDLDIKNMLMYPDNSECFTFKKVIDYIVEIRKKGSFLDHNCDDNEWKIAQKCCSSLRRINKNVPALFGTFEENDKGANVETYTDHFKRKRKYVKIGAISNNQEIPAASILIYDKSNCNFFKYFNVAAEKYANLEGFDLVGYNDMIFMFGGEFRLGSGSWNHNVWVYDTTKEKWERKTKISQCRRNFKSCICGPNLYIIGGTGSFRIIQDNMLTYNITENSWSNPVILPCSTFQMECCSYNNQLLLLSLNNKCGYLYNADLSNFIQLPVCDENHLVKSFPNPFSLISYRNKIYVKGASLIELEIDDNKMRATNYKCFEELKNDKVMNSVVGVSSILCGDTVYTTFNHDRVGNHENGVFTTFVSLSMDTYELKILSKDLPKGTKLFALQQLYNLKGDVFVNSLEHFQLNTH